ncbi:hypothetical protein ACYX34_08575 [Nitrospira sp. CMX1]
MGLTQRLGKIEKHVSRMTANASRRGNVIILRKLSPAPDAKLIGYRAGEGELLPLDRSRWPHVPEGKKLVIQQVWSDDEASDRPNFKTNSELRRPLCESHNASDS